MKRLKTFGKYLLIFVLFFVLSRVLIFIGLNTTYKSITLKNDVPQGVSISSAKATSVNGEIKGKVSQEFDSKYVKFSFYTDIDSLAGNYYITPSELENGNFEFYFKLNHIESYSVEATNEEPPEVVSDEFSLEEYKPHILIGAILILILI